MVVSAVDGIDLFKIAGRSISGWIPSLKTGKVSHIRQPFCSQLEDVAGEATRAVSPKSASRRAGAGRSISNKKRDRVRYFAFMIKTSCFLSAQSMPAYHMGSFLL